MATRSPNGGQPPSGDGDWGTIVDDLESPNLVVTRDDTKKSHPSRDERMDLLIQPVAVETEDTEYPAESTHPSRIVMADSPPVRPQNLRLPPVSKEEEVKSSEPASRSPPLPRAIPKTLFDNSPSPAVKRDQISKQAVLAMLGLIVFGGGVLFVLNRPPPAPLKGMVSVVSDPEGSQIFVNGRPTHITTPAQLDYAVGRTIVVSVRQEGFVAEPKEQVIEVDEDRISTAFFALQASRSLELVTEPAGARVRLNGEYIRGQTPMTVRGLLEGTRARIEVELQDYFPEARDILVGDSAQLEKIVLRRSVLLTVLTEPPGADVYLLGRSDGQETEQLLGTTPVYDVPAPRGEHRALRIKKHGFRRVKRTIRMTRDKRLEVTLKELPLAAMIPPGEERIRVKRLERSIVRAKTSLARAERTLRVMEQRLEDLLADPTSMFGQRAKAETAVDRATDQVVIASDRLTELRDEKERLRAHYSKDQ